jgi:hypothetical protein
MTDWSELETNTHQDHVIAHVIGATVLGYFVWDETAFLLLDIGFVWHIYLDGEMGLVPQVTAIAQLECTDEVRAELNEDIDRIGQGIVEDLQRMKPTMSASPIVSVEFLTKDDGRRVRLNCEESTLIVETSLETAEVNFH